MKPNRKKHAKEIPFFGTMQVTEKHVVSLRCDRGSSYKAYLAVQNELVAAYNELREELAQEKFGKNYAALDEDQQKAIRDVYPQKISEAEPKKYGERVMGKFNKTGKREMPALNTSSLPDLIFTLLFFFMIVTTMREVTLKVEFKVPQATELEKLEKKSLVTFIYVGKPTAEVS